ncbi:hypothetical protein [Pseudomonas laurylsulfativorans]|uniref:hypothetical protein n=1 Tax=Pseudomonas laurylsulfativorans TaxID=1943631 RepID=UPI0013FDE7B3|nr:hypothetical protein [Pseudomonas laurylsulfativorans]
MNALKIAASDAVLDCFRNSPEAIKAYEESQLPPFFYALKHYTECAYGYVIKV